MIHFSWLVVLACILCTSDVFAKAFPGAEGFGANARGGRGGSVYYVTSLSGSGAGSLKHALVNTSGKRYILFKVSGVGSVSGWHRSYGEFTMAGQVSPGGVVLRAFIPNTNIDRPNTFFANGEPFQGSSHIIVRHIRARPDGRTSSWPSGYVQPAEKAAWGVEGGGDDAMRIRWMSDAIFDHLSVGRASDEAIELGESKRVTLQNITLAETIGDHYLNGGLLLYNTSKTFPSDSFTIHHNMFNRIAGRLPLFNCGAEDCVDAVFNWELSNNLIWHGNPIRIRRDENYQGYKPFLQNINIVGNFHYTEEGYSNAMFATNLLNAQGDGPAPSLYIKDNRLSCYDNYSDLELFSCCNNFTPPFREIPADIVLRPAPHPYAPAVSYHKSTELIDYAIKNMGAFPRDPMDRRLIGYLRDSIIDPTPRWERPANDAHAFDWTIPPLPELDTDNDGMPDWWEIHHGSNPWNYRPNGPELAPYYTFRADSADTTSYDNLECYLNRLSDNLVQGDPMVLFPRTGAQVVTISVTPQIFDSSTESLTISVKADANLSVKRVQLSLGHLTAPFSAPAPIPLDISANKDATGYSYRYVLNNPKQIGVYTISASITTEADSTYFGYTHVPCVDSSFSPTQVVAPRGIVRHNIASSHGTPGVMLGWPLERFTNDLLGYVVSLNGTAVDTVVERFYFHPAEQPKNSGTFSVQSLNMAGRLSAPTTALLKQDNYTALKPIAFEEPSASHPRWRGNSSAPYSSNNLRDITVYDLRGRILPANAAHKSSCNVLIVKGIDGKFSRELQLKARPSATK